MNTFFVRAYKKKRRRRRRNTFETWTRKRENGFRKNTSKKSEIKEKQKNHCSLRLTSSLLFFYSSSSFISRFFRSRARRARVNHSWHWPETFIDEPFLRETRFFFLVRW